MVRGLLIAFSTAAVGMILISSSAPWQQVDPADTSEVYRDLGYAPIWTDRFRLVPGAQVDTMQFTLYAIVVIVVAIMAGVCAYIALGTPWWRQTRR